MSNYIIKGVVTSLWVYLMTTVSFSIIWSRGYRGSCGVMYLGTYDCGYVTYLGEKVLSTLWLTYVVAVPLLMLGALAGFMASVLRLPLWSVYLFNLISSLVLVFFIMLITM